MHIATGRLAFCNEYQPDVYCRRALYNNSTRGIGCAKDGYFLINTKFAVFAPVREADNFRYFS